MKQLMVNAIAFLADKVPAPPEPPEPPKPPEEPRKGDWPPTC